MTGSGQNQTLLVNGSFFQDQPLECLVWGNRDRLRAAAQLQLNAGIRLDASKAWPDCNEIPAEIITGTLIPFGIAKIRDFSRGATGHSQS